MKILVAYTACVIITVGAMLFSDTFLGGYAAGCIVGAIGGVVMAKETRA